MGRLLEFVAVSFFHLHPYIDFDFEKYIDRMLQPFCLMQQKANLIGLKKKFFKWT